MLVLALAALVSNAPADDFYHPYYVPPRGPLTLDMRTLEPVEPAIEPPRIGVHELDRLRVDPQLHTPPATRDDGVSMPEGWVQIGSGVYPADVANGLRQVDPIPPGAFEDIPGNKYPRKHTLYLNFVGADLVSTLSGNDISADDISVLAIDGPYPAFTGGNTLAVAIAQAVEADLAPYGVRVVYLERPPRILPYTMEMMGGDWTDTNLDSPAGGVAPSADCSALNQRHVVYTFAEGVNSASLLANTASQEAGHAWGLDHTLNCNSVMSYCGGFTTDGRFSDTCDALCEEQCQGANSIGCRLNHETHCGEGSNAQNEDLELNYLFGGNEPDMQPPVCEILSPADGDHFASGASTSVRVEVDDDYGGMGWQVTIAKDGETVYDEIDFFKENIDADFNAALNLTMLEPATYTVTALCIDHGDNMGEHTITFTVGDAAPPETGGMGSTGGDATGNVGDDTAGQGDTGDGDDDDDTGTGTVPRGDGDGDKGCGCFVRNQGRPGWNWLALGLLAFVARRRRSL